MDLRSWTSYIDLALLNIPTLSDRWKKLVSERYNCLPQEELKRKSILCANIYKGLVVADLDTWGLYQIIQIMRDSPTELDPRVPVLTGVLKAICQHTEVTGVQEHLPRPLALEEATGVPLLAGLHSWLTPNNFQIWKGPLAHLLVCIQLTVCS